MNRINKPNCYVKIEKREINQLFYNAWNIDDNYNDFQEYY